jgi:hypothetical protein
MSGDKYALGSADSMYEAHTLCPESRETAVLSGALAVAEFVGIGGVRPDQAPWRLLHQHSDTHQELRRRHVARCRKWQGKDDRAGRKY